MSNPSILWITLVIAAGRVKSMVHVHSRERVVVLVLFTKQNANYVIIVM